MSQLSVLLLRRDLWNELLLNTERERDICVPRSGTMVVKTKPQKSISKIKRSAEEELWYTHLLFQKIRNPMSNPSHLPAVSG
ncbi:hypothetical protein CEXT_744591 [Caerostris extrusa]|uniref:Uncharacterized protein n=1 Tax=Caerostris extrusa TaxID=172846 RepID=A0AAV4MNF1_CAEEX|nr:hypothetical protein CEXT_744591 [Caerostris extrusa]